MRAARAIVGRNVRTLDVERFHRVSVAERLPRRRQIAQRREHRIRSAGDHRGKEARDAGGESRVDRPRNLFMRRGGRIEIDAREAVHLQIDESRRDPKSSGSVAIDRPTLDRHV